MKSKVFRDLTPLKLTEVTIEDVDQLRAGMFAQGRKNTKGYTDLQQVAVASNQQGGSGSVPGTSIVVAVSNVYDNKSELYSPTIGTWILEAVYYNISGGSGTYTNQLELQHKNGAQMLIVETNNQVARPKIEIDANTSLYANVTGGSSAPSSTVAYAYLMRRR